MDIKTYEEKFLKEYREKLAQEFRRAELIPTYEKTSACPKCGTKTELDYEHAEIYCPECGLIVKASISYVGVYQVVYPYGTLL